MLTLDLEMKGLQRADAAPIVPNDIEIAHPRSDAGMIAALQRGFWVDADHDAGKKTGIVRLRAA